MKQKFINLNCAQMAAVAMWMLFTSQGLQSKVHNYKNVPSFDVVVFLDEGEEIVIPKGYNYTTKTVTHYKQDVTTPPFTSIRFTFEYPRKEDKA